MDVTFSKGVPTERTRQITIYVDIREVFSHDNYLSAPTFVEYSHKKPFLFLVDCIKKRLSNWMDRLVSSVGREVLIKAVAQAIPTYLISVFKFSNVLMDTVQSSINRFWWGHRQESRKIHWIGSTKLCRAKDDGGLGFRDKEMFNCAHLAKKIWHLLQDSNSLATHLLQAKYFPYGNIFTAVLGNRDTHGGPCLGQRKPSSTVPIAYRQRSVSGHMGRSLAT